MNWGAISHLAKGQVAGARKGFDQASAKFAHKMWAVAGVVEKDFDKAITFRNRTRIKARKEVFDRAASSLLWLTSWLRSNTLNATTPGGRAAVLEQLKIVLGSKDVKAARALVRHPMSRVKFAEAETALAHSHIKQQSASRLKAYRQAKRTYDRIGDVLVKPASQQPKDLGVLEIAYQDLNDVRYLIPNNRGARSKAGQQAFSEGFKALKNNPLLEGFRKLFS